MASSNDVLTESARRARDIGIRQRKIALNISIFGLGYVGAVSLACLARDGHRVVGVDVDRAKLDLIAAGRTPVVEEGMVQLMADAAASGRVSVTNNTRDAVMETEISLICVGTPSAANGSQDQTAMLRLSKDLGAAMRDKTAPHVFVFRSTLVAGTVEDVLRPIIETESGKKDGVDFHVCFQPEFLREGSSIRDYDKPPYTIVGVNAEEPATKLKQLFGHLPCEFYTTSIRSAEMVKYCCNNFHALKITFANETARLCEALGVDPFEVMDLVCKDRQLNISPAYLKPGFAFGGSCLPKDLRATMYLAKIRDVDMPMHGAIASSNRSHIDHAIAKVMASGKRKVGMIGLSFKTGTDDLRESPLVLLAEHFLGKGLGLLVYDPEVHLSNLLGANRRFIEQHVPHIGSLIRSDIGEVVVDSEVLVIGLSDSHTIETLHRHVRPGQLVIDLVGIGGGKRLRGEYVGLCW
jgi:GDP-mannose 6-dehydrogenase